MPGSGKAKALAATGVICAMGGYICGDKIDENDKLEQAERPYEMAESLLQDAAEKQREWLSIRENLQGEISSYKITIDSLKRILYQVAEEDEKCEDSSRTLESTIREWENYTIGLKAKNDSLNSLYRLDEREIKIRKSQIDSLEKVAKQYSAQVEKLKEDVEDLNKEYKNRSPIKNEFEAIHNCVNAHGYEMTDYQFERQVKCCIKALKKLQERYPKDKLENLTVKPCEG